MKGSNYIAQRIKKETNVVFGITGGAIVNLFDSLDKKGLTVINNHNEQASAFAADSYARVSGKLGVCVATSGPGITNTITGTCCSFYDSVPVLTIGGQVPTGTLKGKLKKLRQRGFQETDTLPLFKTITKFSERIGNIENVQEDLEKAILIAKTHRKGPTYLDLCDDIQMKEIKVKKVKKSKIILPTYKKEDMKKVIKAINNSKKPLLVIGGGANLDIPTRKQVKRLINKLNIPTFLTWGAMDLLPHNHKLNCRDFGVTSQRIGNFVVGNADLIICLGTRLDTHQVGGKGFGSWTKAKIVVVDIDKEELKKERFYLKIHSDVYQFAKELEKIKIKNWNSWLNKIQNLRKEYIFPNTIPYNFMESLSDYSKEGDIIITDAGQTLTWTMQAWKVKKNQRLFSAFNHSPMGYAVPASIGAQLAKPNNQIICITGDGGFQMNLQELQTIKGYKLPIKIFVLENKGYGMIKQTQSDWSDNLRQRVSCEPYMEDFSNVAKCFGFSYAKINSEDDFKKIKRILNLKGPCLIEVKIPDGTKIKFKLKYGDTMTDLTPHLPERKIKQINQILKEI